jgi:hypothetical protein
MDIFTAVFYYIYIAVSLFYIVCGVVLLLKPQYIQNHIKPLFPVLESFKYQTVTNSINLIGVGLILLSIVKLLENWSVVGLFIAVIISGLEVYLGVKFYYHERNNVSQTLIHVILHTIIIGAVIFFIVIYLSPELSLIQNQAATTFNSIYSWTVQ